VTDLERALKIFPDLSPAWEEIIARSINKFYDNSGVVSHCYDHGICELKYND